MPGERPDGGPQSLSVEGDDGAWTFDRPFTIGRDAACDVVVDSARSSRRHVELIPADGGWRLTDLGSANGTYVDGTRVETGYVASPTDLQIGEGGPHLRLSFGLTAPVASSTPIPSASTPASSTPAAPEPLDPFRPTADELATDVPPAAAGDPAGRPYDHSATPTTSPLPSGEGQSLPRTRSGGEGLSAPNELPNPNSTDDAPTLPPQDTPGSNELANGSPADASSTPPDASSDDGNSDGLRYDDVVERYFGDDVDESGMGDRTRFIRQAYGDLQQAQTVATEKQHSRYRKLIAAALVVSVLALAYAGYQEVRVRGLLANAEDIFYELRSVEVELAQREISIAQQIESNPQLEDSLTVDLERSRATRRRIAARYDKYVSDAGFYDGKSSEEELIHRTARAFGESELTIPPEFVDEVKVQIRYWKNGRRFVEGVRRAQVEGHDVAAVRALRRHGMPTEFFYLALQESDFKTRAVGPWTRYGHAKGAWQFIPETGHRYGLTPGPLVDTNQYDPLDERHDFDQAADAAARYLRDIYVHLAQASGLLVCASYNWGEGRVRKNMRQIQRDLSDIENSPEARTYWKFLDTYRHRMPSETKDYVMKIFAAAVIGQNPRQFGIDLDPPVEVALRGGRGGIRTNDAPTGERTTRLGGDALDARQLDAELE